MSKDSKFIMSKEAREALKRLQEKSKNWDKMIEENLKFNREVAAPDDISTDASGSDTLPKVRPAETELAELYEYYSKASDIYPLEDDIIFYYDGPVVYVIDTGIEDDRLLFMAWDEDQWLLTHLSPKRLEEILVPGGEPIRSFYEKQDLILLIDLSRKTISNVTGFRGLDEDKLWDSEVTLVRKRD